MKIFQFHHQQRWFHTSGTNALFRTMHRSKRLSFPSR